MPIGAADPAVFREATAILPPGSPILLYTDGSWSVATPRSRSASTSSPRCPGPAAEDLAGLCETSQRQCWETRSRATTWRSSPSGRCPWRHPDQLTLPAEPGSLAQLRRRLARFLHATGATELEHYEITLTICEAAGNAIEHAYGPGDATYEVEVAFDDGELTASVRDTGTWREKRGEHRGAASGIIEDLMDEVAVERHDGGTLIRMRRRIHEEQAA